MYWADPFIFKGAHQGFKISFSLRLYGVQSLRGASCKAWPEPIGHISFFAAAAAREIDSWHAPFKKSICLVKLKNVFRTNRRATTKQWIMNWRRRAEKGERVVLQQKVIHPLTFSLFSFYSGTQRFACESIIDALTIIENQCSIKTLLLFYFNQQQKRVTNITSANFPIITLLKMQFQV